MSLENNIPKHWQVKKLGEVTLNYDGRRRPVSRVIRAKRKGTYRYYGATEIVDYIDDFIFDGIYLLIGEDGANLVSKSRPLAFIVEGKFWVNNHAHVLQTKEVLSIKFLSYYFNSLNLAKFISGSAQPKLNQANLNKIYIPIPPLPEQLAIVSKIEELLSDLENGKQQLLTAQQQLKVYRQSLLNVIVTGEKLQPIITVILKLDQGWSPKCLNEHSNDNNEWAVIKTSAVQYGKFVSVENKVLPLNLKPREQHELIKGDILITRAGPRIRVGVCCLVRSTRPKLINCDKVYRIKVKETIVMPEYFVMVINAPYYQHEIEKMKSGISDSGVNLTQVQFLKIEIPIPSIIEQQQIVDELESKLTVCDNIEETIKEALLKSESLRQSILKKAFSGKLL